MTTAHARTTVAQFTVLFKHWQTPPTASTAPVAVSSECHFHVYCKAAGKVREEKTRQGKIKEGKDITRGCS